MNYDTENVIDPKNKLAYWKIFASAMLVFLTALAVRCVGVKFAFPLFTHPDEGIIMHRLRDMSIKFSLDPGSYPYPAFPSYYSKFIVLNALSKLKFGVNYGYGYWQDPHLFFTVSRLMTAVQGALLPVLAWFIGRKYKQVSISWMAAAFFTFYPVFVLHSHYVSVDIPLTLFVMLVLLCCLNYLSSKRNYWLILATVMVAISGLEKYPGILSVGIVWTSIAIRAFSRDEQGVLPGWSFFFKTMAWSLGVTVLAFILIAPQLFIHISTTINNLVREARPTHLGADGLSWGGNMFFYLRNFYSNAGVIISGLSIIGLLTVVLMKDPTYLLLFFGCGYWIALSKLHLHHIRWSLPMVTTPLFLAAVGASFLWQKTVGRKPARIALSVILMAGVVPFALKGMVTSIMLTWQDTRNDALHFLEENKITTDNTISDGYTPFNPGNKNSDFLKFDIFEPGEKEYIILSSMMFDRYAAEPDRYITQNAFYSDVRNHLKLIKEFQPDAEPTSVAGQLKVIFEYFRRLVRDDKDVYLTGPTLQIYAFP